MQRCVSGHNKESDMTGIAPRCIDFPQKRMLAGYVPTSNITEVSRDWQYLIFLVCKEGPLILHFESDGFLTLLYLVFSKWALIDLDILPIEIFMKMGAYDAAKYYYMNGHSSCNGLWFHKLADVAHKMHDSRVITLQQSYNKYFYNDEHYDHNLIKEKGRFSDATPEQHTEFVTKTLQYMVMYMHPLSKLYETEKKCTCQEYTSQSHIWDQGAASLIGSIEGRPSRGKSQGKLMYNLVKKIVLNLALVLYRITIWSICCHLASRPG